jgi:hypothetical protein
MKNSVESYRRHTWEIPAMAKMMIYRVECSSTFIFAVPFAKPKLEATDTADALQQQQQKKKPPIRTQKVDDPTIPTQSE